MADISGNMAAALGYLDFGPSAYQKNKIMQALLQRQENMQTQMGYTGGTPAQQAAGMDYLNLPVSDRNAQSDALAVKLSDEATARRREGGMVGGLTAGKPTADKLAPGGLPWLPGASATLPADIPMGESRKAEAGAIDHLPVNSSEGNFLMGEEAANAPLLWNPVEGRIKAAGARKPAAGKAPNEETEWGKILRNIRLAQGMGAQAPIAVVDQVVDDAATRYSNSMGIPVDEPDPKKPGEFRAREEVRRLITRKLNAANSAIGG